MGETVSSGADAGGRLDGRVAVVTGAGQGIGRAIAERLGRAGAVVAIAERNAEVGTQTAADLTAAGMRAHFCHVDVRERSSVEAMADFLLKREGTIDILVNNAGVAAAGPSVDVSDEEWDAVYGVLLRGTFLCSQVVGRAMLARGSGAIVNICSIAGVGGWAQRALYSPAKAGTIVLTQVLGCEWGRHGVRVNGVNPGQIETPLNEYVFSRGLADRSVFANRAPMRRIGDPEEIAEAVLFLCSDEAGDINAEVLTVDGGWLAFGGVEELIGV